MAVSVVMPALEMAQETGKLLAWRKQEGDRVTKGEPLLEIETDKAVVEVEAPGDGILSAVRAAAGAVVPVGQVIAWLVAPGEIVPADATFARSGRAPAGDGPALAATGTSEARSSDRRFGAAVEIRISPKARRLARERGVDLATIKGSGPEGEILAGDIPEVGGLQSEFGTRHAAAASAPSEIPNLQSRYSAVMAERTAKSWTTVPHFFLAREIDASALVAAREQHARGTHTDRLIALVARVLTKHPQMNASWIDGAIRINPDVNVAIAIAVSDAVVTGVIHNAASLPVADIAVRRQELAGRARAGRLQPRDISGATFTISNLGMYQVDAFTAIIVPPQAGILAVGAITDRVVAVAGQAAVRPMTTVTLSCDHRVIDGARAAAFLNDVADAVRRPEAWLA
jgi:pyruvate dehydrogenase E2 component (dihydrolipoamide acetyltransferase)